MKSIDAIKVPKESKKRSSTFFYAVVMVIVVLIGLSAYWAFPKGEKERRLFVDGKTISAKALPTPTPTPVITSNHSTTAQQSQPHVVLTASGYIIPRRRIEVSPRIQGLVKWIGVEKGEPVQEGQLLVKLDDEEAQAQLSSATARIETAEAQVRRVEAQYRRIKVLVDERVESEEAEEKVRLELEVAMSSLREAIAQREVAVTQLSYTTISAPISGVVLEKLAELGELVTPQSFGGTRGPSTALVSLADLKDLQVEMDLSETDLSKVFLGQRCQVIPEAYADKVYDGEVVEISPEADRQKGTLQVKVKIHQPDQFLIPELSARVDFLNPTKTQEVVEEVPELETVSSSEVNTVE